MIRVLLVDDQAMVLAGLRVILASSGDIDVVAEASSGPDAVTLCKVLEPDVVCMDVRMPGGDGLTATRAIVEAGLEPTPRVLVMTTFDSDEHLFGALEAGASGFVRKDSEPEELVEAVRRLARGGASIDPGVTERVIAEFARRSSRATDPDAVELLTPRELEIVELVALGRSNDEIGRELHIATTTVKSHLGSVLSKTDTRDRLQLALWARDHGLGG